MEEEQVEKCLTAKEQKARARPEFDANYEKFYPVATLEKFGFSRAECPKCGAKYWRHSEKADTCGDSGCKGKYTFVGTGVGVGKGPDGHKMSYTDAWNSFSNAFKNMPIEHTILPRYPVVARWRNDVEYVAAGIFCFQPFCVTGELAPPANPLAMAQFCLRFNDLDNIGLSGRHYSGFNMLGLQVFNSADNWVYFKEECVEFNLTWLIETLKIDPDEITLIEDVWAGGGNLGPSVEYFIGGLEVGNMVFMQYKTFNDGTREELAVKVIDVGIGLERIPWLVNGSVTSYIEVFGPALKYLEEQINLSPVNETWEKFGPYSCLLNMDEVNDLDAVWKSIGESVGVEPAQLRRDIEPVRDMYIVLDHTRTLLVAIHDGSLPSNTGGASNLRNILRRVFSILHKRGWWEKLGMEGLLKLFGLHKEILSTIYGPMGDYPSFDDIIRIEYQRWLTTDKESKVKLDKLVKKNKGTLSIKDWIMCVGTFGLDPDRISSLTGLEIPGNLFSVMDEMAERTAKVAPKVLYDTTHLPATIEAFYDRAYEYNFEAKIVETLKTAEGPTEGQRDLVILNETLLYPTGGGQEHDVGTLEIDGVTYTVDNVFKAGPCVLHHITPALPEDLKLENVTVKGTVDQVRRDQLRVHHTATHVMCAAARKILGPHIWQNGAKKTFDQCHLDITHYVSLTHEEEVKIEKEANLMIQSMAPVIKKEWKKDEAEKKWGFSLYQGGFVPGNTVRIVDIEGIDTEACCGTHCDSIGEIGIIRLLKSNRISDGVVRMYFVAGPKALEANSLEASYIYDLCQSWGVQGSEVVQTGARFFDGYKKSKKLASTIPELEIRLAVAESADKVVLKTDAESPTYYISPMGASAKRLHAAKKAVVVVGKSFAYGMVHSDTFDVSKIKPLVDAYVVPEGTKPVKLVIKEKVTVTVKEGKKKSKLELTGLKEFQLFGINDDLSASVSALLSEQNFEEQQ